MPKWSLTLPFLRWLLLSLSLTILDQCLKSWAVYYLMEEARQPLSFLTLQLCYNRGVGFSLLAHTGDTLLIITLISFIFVLKELFYLQENVVLPYQRSMGLSFILGGGLSNLYDRVRFGAIIDFININIIFFKTLIFNLADVFIVIGTGLVLLASINLPLTNHTYR